MKTWKFTIDTKSPDLESDITFYGQVECKMISIEEKFDLMVAQTMTLNEKNELVPATNIHPLVQMKSAIATVDKYLVAIDLKRTCDDAPLANLEDLKFMAGNDHIYMAIYSKIIQGPKLGNG
jgi:hypothetical protein